MWTKPADLTTEGEAPEGRRSHSALNLNGNLVVFGGFNSKTNKHKNDLWMYRPDKNSWQALTPSGKGPGPRRRQAFCLVVSRDLPEEGFIVKHFLKMVTHFSHEGSLDIVQSFHFRSIPSDGQFSDKRKVVFYFCWFYFLEKRKFRGKRVFAELRTANAYLSSMTILCLLILLYNSKSSFLPQNIL